jgi:hypothetical protein
LSRIIALALCVTTVFGVFLMGFFNRGESFEAFTTVHFIDQYCRRRSH